MRISRTFHQLWVLASVLSVGCVEHRRTEIIWCDADGPAPPPVPPTLTDMNPPHASYVEALTAIAVQGQLELGSAPIKEVTLNGETAALGPRGFTTTLPVEAGVNLVSLRITAEDGGRAVEGRAFHAGARYPDGTTLGGALAIHWSPLFLDDNDPDPDDVATAAETLLEDPVFLAGLVAPFDTEYATLTPTGVQVQSATVDLNPVDGALIVDLTLEGVQVDADVEGKGIVQVLSGPATVAYTRLTLHLELELSVDAGAVSVTTREMLLTPEGFSFTSEALDGASESVRSALNDVVKELVEKAISDTLRAALETRLPALLGGLAYSGVFLESSPVAVDLRLESAVVRPTGVDVQLSARVTPVAPLEQSSGSLRQDSVLPDLSGSTSAMAVAVTMDALNQALSAAWGAGIASRNLEGEALSGLTDDALPAIFQPTHRVELSAALPPTVLLKPHEDPGLPLQLTLGELRISLEVGADPALNLPERGFSCLLGAQAAMGLTLDANNLLGVQLDTRPRALKVAVGCPEVPPSYDPGDLSAVLRLGLPSLLEKGSKALAIPLPGLPLSALVSTGPLATMEVVLQNARFGAAGDALTLEGDALYRPVPPPQ